jgi:predicted DNA-binding protein
MNKLKRDTVSINARLERSTSERLGAYCEEYGVTKTFALEKAINTYLDKQIEAPKMLKKFTEE